MKKKEKKIRQVIMLDKQIKSGTIIKIDGVVYRVKSSIEEGFLSKEKGFYTTLEVIQ